VAVRGAVADVGAGRVIDYDRHEGAMRVHLKGVIAFLLFVAVLSLALIPKWGIIAAACLIVIDWLLVFAGGWGRSGLTRSSPRPSSH
jgi:hypothetical protein